MYVEIFVNEGGPLGIRYSFFNKRFIEHQIYARHNYSTGDTAGNIINTDLMKLIF